MKFDSEFKEALSALSGKEKDKLIFRLLKRDRILAERLYFELVSTDSLAHRRENMVKQIEENMKHKSTTFLAMNRLLTYIRKVSAEITEHVKITSDKYGEASLNILMLSLLMKYNSEKISRKQNELKTEKLCIYVIARTFKILTLVKALDSDYWMEFEDSLKQLGELISNNPYMMEVAINNKFDINWLLSADIPDDIVAIQKEVRSMGLLR